MTRQTLFKGLAVSLCVLLILLFCIIPAMAVVDETENNVVTSVSEQNTFDANAFGTNAFDTNTLGVSPTSLKDIPFKDWTQSTSMPTDAGNYRLMKDVFIGNTWHVPTGETNLDLNGHSITFVGKGGSVISVGSSVTLNLYDQVGTGEITGGNVIDSGGGVCVDYGDFVMYGGNIVGNTAFDGGGVGVQSGNLTMYGGNIENNTAVRLGGGLDVYNGYFVMHGGTIKHNFAGSGAGVRLDTSDLVMYGGSISNNVASGMGGGLHLSYSRFFFLDGNIQGNSAWDFGGGISMNYGYIEMSGGSIADNYVNNELDVHSDYISEGGGVYIGYSSDFDMYSGNITGNRAENGAGVWVSDGRQFEMHGGKISGNTAKYDGGGVYVSGDDMHVGNFVMFNGIISDNTAINGGGLYGDGGKFTIHCGNITGNTATSNGGGIYISNGSFTMSSGKLVGNTALNSASNNAYKDHESVISLYDGYDNDDIYTGSDKLQIPIITSPINHTEHKAGNPLSIQWTYAGDITPDKYTVELFREGVLYGSWDTTSKSYTIPAASLIQTGNYSVDVYPKKDGHTEQVWGNVKFGVVKSFEITNPTAGQKVSPSTAFTVTWTNDNAANKYLISLRDINTEPGTLLYNHTDVGYSTSFTIPANRLVAGHPYRVAVAACKNGITVWDECEFVAANMGEDDDDGKLQSPRVTTPVNYSEHKAGNPLSIQWTYTGDVTPDKYEVKLLREGVDFGSWFTTSKSYTIPADKLIQTGNYSVYVYPKKAGHTENVLGNVVFEVVKSFEITSPTAGQKVSPSTAFTVTWTKDNAAEKYLISLRDINTEPGTLLYNHTDVGYSTSFTIPANRLVAGHPYRVAVAACKNGITVWDECEFVAANVGEDDDGIIFDEWTPTSLLPTTAGNYKLMNDVSISSTWNVPTGETNLDLNGHSIAFVGEEGRVIYVESGVTLNLYDRVGTGKITGGNTAGSGGGVFVNSGMFNMYGGNISGNTADDGGGVYVVGTDGTFTMYDGSISGNAAEGGGGIYMAWGGIFIMFEGTISNNTVSDSNGGGAYASNGGTLIMNGGTISNNTVIGGSGGGVCVAYGGTLIMNGGKITSHMAYRGGGVCVWTGGTFEMSSGSIYNNTARYGGSGVLMEGSFVIGGNATINANNDVYLSYSNVIKPIEVVGSKFTGSVMSIKTYQSLINDTPIVRIAGNSPISAENIINKFALQSDTKKLSIGDDGKSLIVADKTSGDDGKLQSPIVTSPVANIEHPTGNPLVIQWTYSGDVTPDNYEVQLFREGVPYGSWNTISKSYTIPAASLTQTGKYSVDVYPKKAGQTDDVWGNVMFEVVKSFTITTPTEGQAVSNDAAFTIKWTNDNAAEKYLLSLRNSTTNTLVYERMNVGTATSFEIPANTLMDGSSYKVAVGVCKNGIELWEIRNFTTGSNSNALAFTKHLLSLLGKNGDDFGYAKSEWCALFIGDRAKDIGYESIIPRPSTGKTGDLITGIFNSGGSVVCFPYPKKNGEDYSLNFPENKVQSVLTTKDEVPTLITDRSSFKPEVGDIIGVLWDSGINDHTISHVEVITEINGNTITSISGNTGNSDNAKSVVGIHKFNWVTGRYSGNLGGTIVAYARPAYSSITQTECKHTHTKYVAFPKDGITKDFPMEYNETHHYWYAKLECEDCGSVIKSSVKIYSPHNPIINEIAGICECNHTNYGTEITYSGDAYAKVDSSTYLVPEIRQGYVGGSIDEGEKVSILTAENILGLSDWTLIEYHVPSANRYKMRFVRSDTLEKEDLTLKKVTIKFRASDKGSIEYKFAYGDSLFKSTSTKYNHDLAKISLGLAAASFTNPAADINVGGSDLHHDDLGSIRSEHIKNAYEELEFTNAVYYNYNIPVSDSSNKVAYSIAEKKLFDGSTLYVVVPRGGGYGAEWASNFDIGTGPYAKGFKEPTDDIYKTLISRLDNDNIDNSETKIWITGFSRGGAVANLLGGELDRHADELGLVKDNIYVYTFATPQGVDTIPSVNRDVKTDYKNIFNIINPSDLVPTVPLSSWGYDRYGSTYYFNYMATDSYDKIGDTHKKITGLTYHPIDLYNSVTIFGLMLANNLGNKVTYAETHSAYICTALNLIFDDNTNKPHIENLVSLDESIIKQYPVRGPAAIQYAKKLDLKGEGAQIRQSLITNIDRMLSKIDQITGAIENIQTFVIFINILSGITIDDLDSNDIVNDLKDIKGEIEEQKVIDFSLVKRDGIARGELSFEVIAAEVVDIASAGEALFSGDPKPIIKKFIKRIFDLGRNIVEIGISEEIARVFVVIGHINGKTDVTTSMGEFYNIIGILSSLITLSENGHQVGLIPTQHHHEVYMAWVCSDEPISKIYTDTIPKISDLKKVTVDVVATPNDFYAAYGTQEYADSKGVCVVLFADKRKDVYGPFSPGISFIGWYDENGKLISTNQYCKVIIAKDSVFTAKFGYKINYQLNGGKNNPQNPTGHCASDGYITLKAPTKDGYTFEGWIWNGQNTPVKDVTFSYRDIGEKTYSAVWSKTISLTPSVDGEFYSSGTSIGGVSLSGAKVGDTAIVTELAEIEYGLYESTLNTEQHCYRIDISGSANTATVLQMYNIEPLSNLDIGNRDAVIFFTVKKTDLPNKVKPDDIRMCHFENGRWVELFTKHQSDEDTSDLYHYAAVTNSFSPFAIGYTTDPLEPITDTRASANAITPAMVKYRIAPSNISELVTPLLTRNGKSIPLDDSVIVNKTVNDVEISVPATVNLDGTLNIKSSDIAGADSITVTFIGRKIGDVSGDGSPNTLDAAMILKASAEIEALDVKGDFYGDVTNDGQTTTLDAARILQHSADMTDDDYELIG